jgi:cytosine/adenosine deaminase-related metal-dependent hydrolase
VLAHCILLDDHPQIAWHTHKDLDLIAEAGASVAHCPQPFARYGLAMDHVGRYRTRGVNVGLGTDCAPHNLIEEMRLAIVAGRLMSEDIRSLDTAGAFEAATFGGATALGRNDIGALAPGMAADIVLVDLNHPLMQPVRDPLRSSCSMPPIARCGRCWSTARSCSATASRCISIRRRRWKRSPRRRRA